jgi:hypothetical protein
MAEEQLAYLSYLLRLWRVSGDEEVVLLPFTPEEYHRVEEKAVWRASLESVRTGERKVFASLDDLFGFLREQTNEQVEGTVAERPDCLSYLLRLWRVGDDGESHHAGGMGVWRASLESVRTGERKVFASLDDLFDFLREQAGVSPGS